MVVAGVGGAPGAVGGKGQLNVGVLGVLGPRVPAAPVLHGAPVLVTQLDPWRLLGSRKRQRSRRQTLTLIWQTGELVGSLACQIGTGEVQCMLEILGSGLTCNGGANWPELRRGVVASMADLFAWRQSLGSESQWCPALKQPVARGFVLRISIPTDA